MQKLNTHSKIKNKLSSKQVKTIAGKIVSKQGCVSTVDLLVEIGWLNQKNLVAWKTGKIPYLEAIVTANLKKISSVMKELMSWAAHSKLKASITDYKYKNIRLRFSKSGNADIETAYSTYYVLLKQKVKEGVKKQPHNETL